MPKSFLTVISVTLLLFWGQDVRSQQSRVAEREAEWDAYVLPHSTFVRQTDSSKAVLFRVPSDWQQQPVPDKLEFSGPHDTSLKVIVEKIPDGSALQSYVSAIMQSLRGVSESPDSILVRGTTMSGLDAREIMFETNAGSVDLTRRIIWSTVRGSNALSVIFIAPLARVAEVEPYFKAVVQSVTFVNEFDYERFYQLRSSAITEAKPQRVDEVQSLAESLSTIGSSNRQANIAKLASMLTSAPDSAIDLALDRRPMVRAAVFEAIVQSRNSALEKFLLRGLDDRELFVAEQVARAIAANPNVVGLLRENAFDWFGIEPLVRVWPFLSRTNQIKILEEIFARPLVPAEKPPKVENLREKTSVTVRATVLSPGAPPPPLPATADPSRYLTALTLLRDLPPSEFKLPLNSILAAKNDSLTALALVVAWHREEVLPVSELLKLLASSSNYARRLAALHLGQSASVADIKSIEGYGSKPVVGGNTADSGKKIDINQTLGSDLQLTISKIRLREQLSTASGEARKKLIEKNLADPKLAEWVWYRYVKENLDRPEAKSHASRQAKVLPLGENLFPKDVTYYAALPQPANVLDKLSSAIEGLQLDSARSQANFVLILNFLQEQLAQELNSPRGTSPLLYSGVDLNQPIALAKWFAEGAPKGIPSAEREAIILRVNDRARFERLLARYQQIFGAFNGLTDVFSGGVRFLPVLPALLPVSAKAILEGSIKLPKQIPLLTYTFVGASEWNGHSIKLVEQRKVDDVGGLTRDSAYLTYLGDTAVLAPDLDSLREVLTHVANEQPTLATNSDFKRIVETPGEAIYLSDLRQVVASPEPVEDNWKGLVTESGALRISNSSLENLYEIRFSESDWLQQFKRFHPDELLSPRELLPRTTVAYYFMNFDSVAAWRDWSSHLFNAEQRKDLTSIWAIDFEKEILPELGPECGAAVLGLPNFLAEDWELPWVAFFKLKTDKLARALEAGKVLTGGAAGTGPTHVKLKSGELFVAARDGFLVLSNSAKGINALDHKEKLISSRDFSRAAKRAPADLVAFGGYNLEAAISSIADSGADAVKTQQSSLISSLANAFHSPNFYATATSDAVQGRLSLSMDREGRFSVSELASLSREYRLTYAQLEARGLPIQNQERLSSLKIRVRATAAGEIDRIKDDISSPYQTVEKISERELDLRVLPRNTAPKTSLSLPVKDAKFDPYLKPTSEIRSDDTTVINKAREIVGEERDAWSVARKLADWTYKNITWKRVDYATAPQTLATLEADCLEFSQLYVAMARSLGLPARIVSGLAHSGGSFGAHAWVEVYAGSWIEVDPTWGTDYVDATHIRDSMNGSLLAYAALNLVELEVLEVPRSVAEYQKDVRVLAEKLCQELPEGSSTALTSALDLAVLTDENPTLGAWHSLSDSEREVMSSAYRRILLSINSELSKRTSGADELRLLRVKETGETAEALVIHPTFNPLLVKLSFVRRNGAWFLSEILQTDTDFHLISETLRPTIKSILDRRNNKSAPSQSSSEFVRTLAVMQKDAKAALSIVERILKDDPKNQGLRHLKALALLQDDRKADAIQLWKELAGEEKPFAPAVLNLAWQHDNEEDQAQMKLAIEFYIRYRELEPDDPRTHVALARLYDNRKDDALAEAEHRAALKRDPSNTGQFVEFAAFLAIRKRFDEVEPIIAEAEKKARPDDDLFGDLMSELHFTEDEVLPELLARSQPQRMGKSAWANLYLAYTRLENGKSLQAIPLLRKAAALEVDWAEPYTAMARAYRALRNWKAALNAAETAIKIEPENSEDHFHKACALARLGRINAALKSLEKSIELDPDQVETIKDEPDLKVLASRPSFKKLLSGHERQQ